MYVCGMDDNKTCNGICGKTFPNSSQHFYFRKSSRNGKIYSSTYCKDCERTKSRNDKKKRWDDPVKGKKMRKDAKIHTSKPEIKAKISLSLKKKYSEDKEYRENLKMKGEEKRKDPEERKKIRIRAQKYYQNNKKEIIAKAKEKQRIDPKLRIRGFMRGRISEAIARHKNDGVSKNGTPSLQYLDYTWDTLYRHIEGKFLDWMTFSNYGPYNPEIRTWHIDHIIPQVFFPYHDMDSELFKMCWSLENLRPLEAEKNLKDGNREHLLGKSRNIYEIFREVAEAKLSKPWDGELSEVISALSSIPAVKESCSMSQIGLSYLDSIFTQRFSSNTIRMPSLVEAVSDYHRIFRALLYITEKGRKYTPESIQSNLKYQIMLPGHFFPSAAASVIAKYLPQGGSFFDPFLGWGGRTLAALCSPASRIVGSDLQPGIAGNCEVMASAISGEVSTEFHTVDALEFLKGSDEKFDLIFTSPPYYDTENYGVKSDSMSEDWIDLFVFPFTSELKRHLKPGGKVCLHLKDISGAAALTAYHSGMKASGFSKVAKHRYSKSWSQAIYVYEVLHS